MTAHLWPTNGDYVDAVQDVGCFTDVRLRNGTLATSGTFGLPLCATGQSAIVFRMEDASGARAIRCFTGEPSDGATRYSAIADFDRSKSHRYLAACDWQPSGITVRGRTWPLVVMEWVDGEPLHRVVASMRGDTDALIDLAMQWRGLMQTMREDRFAHGDLSHTNVMRDSRGELRVVDYDGVWLPVLETLPPREMGHPNFQHPQRIESAAWGEAIDGFAALSIYVSIVATAHDAALWDDFHNGENLLFTANDYRQWSSSLALTRVRTHESSEVRALGEILATACRHSVASSGDLESLLSSASFVGGTIYVATNAHEQPPWWNPAYDDVEPVPSAPVVGEWQSEHSQGAMPSSPSTHMGGSTSGTGDAVRASRFLQVSALIAVLLLVAVIIVAATMH